MSIRNLGNYGEFFYFLERPQLIEDYDSVILELIKSDSKFPHPDKKHMLKSICNNFWMTNFVREKIYLYKKFYDRNVKDILDKSDSEIKSDLYNLTETIQITV